MIVQAKETLEALFSDSTGENYPYIDKFGQAVHAAIQALEEVEQYRALGTVEELKEAREKQVAKKIIRQKGECYAMTKDGKAYHEQLLLCPNCHRAIKRTEALDVHCKYCGQTIDWEEGGTSD